MMNTMIDKESYKAVIKSETLLGYSRFHKNLTPRKKQSARWIIKQFKH